MVWLFLFLLCVSSMDVIHASRGKIALFPEFCQIARKATWHMPTFVVVDMMYGNMVMGGLSKKMFMLDSAEDAKTFMVEIREHCRRTADKEIALYMDPLDLEGVKREFPSAVTVQRSGESVYVSEILCNDDSCDLVERGVWDRMTPEQREQVRDVGSAPSYFFE